MWIVYFLIKPHLGAKSYEDCNKPLVTADELLQMPKDSYRYELIEGELHDRLDPFHLHQFFLPIDIYHLKVSRLLRFVHNKDKRQLGL